MTINIGKNRLILAVGLHIFFPFQILFITVTLRTRKVGINFLKVNVKFCL